MRLQILFAGVLLAFGSWLPTAASGPPARPQDRSQETGLVAGQVIDGVSRQPIEGVSVVVGSGSDVSVKPSSGNPASLTCTGPHSTRTDTDGRFRIAEVPSGQLVMLACKDGFLIGFEGAIGPTDRMATPELHLAPGERITGIIIPLWRSARMGGLVESDDGRPLSEVQVHLLRREYIAGELVWVSDDVTWSDEGRFRFDQVPPGDYLVLVPRTGTFPMSMSRAEIFSAGSGQIVRAPVFFPEAFVASGARPIRVGPGDQVDSLELRVRVRDASAPDTFTVSGRFDGPHVRPDEMEMMLFPADSPDAMARVEAVLTVADRTGAFRFDNVPPGRYRLLAGGWRNSRRTLSSEFWPSRFQWRLMFGPGDWRGSPTAHPDTSWASTTLTVMERDLENLVLTPQPGARFRGRVVFEGVTPPTDEERTGTVVVVEPSRGLDLGPVPQTRMDPDGRFASVGLPPGRYLVNGMVVTGEAARWGIVSVRTGGRDRLHQETDLATADIADVVVTFSDRIPRLRGVVRDSGGAPTSLARVIVFPRDPDRRGSLVLPLVRQLLVDRTGRFSASLAPGSYFVAAVDDVPFEWRAPDFLNALAGTAVPVDLALGATVETDVRLPARRR